MLSIELRFDLGPDSRPCQVQSGASAQPLDYGPWFFLWVEGDVIGGRVLSHADTGGSVHVGGVDTRTSLDGPGFHASWGTTFWTGCSGMVVVTLVGRWLEPSDFTNGTAAFLSFTSDKPFRYLGARGGQDAFLADEHTLSGGAGFEVFPLGAASLGDVASIEMTATNVRATGGSFTAERYTRIGVQHPSGGTEWKQDLNSEPAFLEDGAGPYTFSVDHAGNAGGVYVGAWAVEPQASGEGRVNGPAGPSP